MFYSKSIPSCFTYFCRPLNFYYKGTLGKILMSIVPSGEFKFLPIMNSPCYLTTRSSSKTSCYLYYFPISIYYVFYNVPFNLDSNLKTIAHTFFLVLTFLCSLMKTLQYANSRHILLSASILVMFLSTIILRNKLGSSSIIH